MTIKSFRVLGNLGECALSSKIPIGTVVNIDKPFVILFGENGVGKTGLLRLLGSSLENNYLNFTSKLPICEPIPYLGEQYFFRKDHDYAHSYYVSKLEFRNRSISQFEPSEGSKLHLLIGDSDSDYCLIDEITSAQLRERFQVKLEEFKIYFQVERNGFLERDIKKKRWIISKSLFKGYEKQIAEELEEIIDPLTRWKYLELEIDKSHQTYLFKPRDYLKESNETTELRERGEFFRFEEKCDEVSSPGQNLMFDLERNLEYLEQIFKTGKVPQYWGREEYEYDSYWLTTNNIWRKVDPEEVTVTYILDEPTIFLSYRNKQRFRERLCEMIQKYPGRLQVIMTTNDAKLIDNNPFVHFLNLDLERIELTDKILK